MNNCICCNIVNGNSSNPFHKTIIPMEGGWVLNHYGDRDRNRLGRLVLAPKKHRRNFSELNVSELLALGDNIRLVENALLKYNFAPFDNDRIEHVYVAYFNESDFGHLHIHFIPRTQSMFALMKFQNCEVDAWKMGYALEKFTNTLCEKDVQVLMTNLRISLEAKDKSA